MRPSGHVRADLAEDAQGDAVCAALDGRQVDTGETREWGAGIAPGLVGLFVSMGLGG
jgi:hypothetical protein